MFKRTKNLILFWKSKISKDEGYFRNKFLNKYDRDIKNLAKSIQEFNYLYNGYAMVLDDIRTSNITTVNPNIHFISIQLT